MILAFSWRNIWRNTMRSVVVITAIALGVSGGLFSMAFVNGMSQGRIRSAVANEVGDIQIHDSLYLRNPDIHAGFDSAQSIQQAVRQTPEVRSAAVRLHLTAMASTAETGNGVQIIGVDPDEEMTVSGIPDNTFKGSYLSETGRNPMVIGKKLADKLKVGLKSKVIITLQGFDSVLVGGAFKVQGIYRTQNSTFDEMTVFVRSDDLRAIASLPDGFAHEILVRVDDRREADRIAVAVGERLPGNFMVQSWRERAPDLAMLDGFMNYMMYLFLAIILIALAFGIVNTMLMVILERRRELGMLIAVGMTRGNVFRMIMSETILLSLTGGICGMALAAAGIGIAKKYGIDLSGVSEGLSAMGLGTVIHPSIGPGIFLIMTVMIVVTATVSALYPAFKSVRINPATAIRDG